MIFMNERNFREELKKGYDYGKKIFTISKYNEWREKISEDMLIEIENLREKLLKYKENNKKPDFFVPDKCVNIDDNKILINANDSFVGNAKPCSDCSFRIICRFMYENRR